MISKKYFYKKHEQNGYDKDKIQTQILLHHSDFRIDASHLRISAFDNAKRGANSMVDNLFRLCGGFHRILDLSSGNADKKS